MLEKAPYRERGGNSRFSGGLFRFAYDGLSDLELSRFPSDLGNHRGWPLPDGRSACRPYRDGWRERRPGAGERPCGGILPDDDVDEITRSRVGVLGVVPCTSRGRRPLHARRSRADCGSRARAHRPALRSCGIAEYSRGVQRSHEAPRDSPGAGDRRGRRKPNRRCRDAWPRGGARRRRLPGESRDAASSPRAGMGAGESARLPLRHRRGAPSRVGRRCPAIWGMGRVPRYSDRR